MKTRKLGQGLEVSELGLGCMGMSTAYGAADETESMATIHRALDLGVNFLDTADGYGHGANEQLVGKAIKDRRDVLRCTASVYASSSRLNSELYYVLMMSAIEVSMVALNTSIKPVMHRFLGWELTTSICTTYTASIRKYLLRILLAQWQSWYKKVKYAT